MSMLNLRHLIDDMKANLRVITAFDFSYKGKIMLLCAKTFLSNQMRKSRRNISII